MSRQLWDVAREPNLDCNIHLVICLAIFITENYLHIFEDDKKLRIKWFLTVLKRFDYEKQVDKDVLLVSDIINRINMCNKPYIHIAQCLVETQPCIGEEGKPLESRLNVVISQKTIDIVEFLKEIINKNCRSTFHKLEKWWLEKQKVMSNYRLK